METFRRTFNHSGTTTTNNDENESDDEPSNETNLNHENNKKREAHQTEHKPEHERKPSPILTGGGGIGRIEMLFRCNLLALVGGGNSPQYQKNKVLIWDDHLRRPIGELSFRHRVLTVKLRRDRICVALKDRIYVYNFSNLALLDTIVTGNNPLGLLYISTEADASSGSSGGNNSTRNTRADESGMVLACPSVKMGQVRVELYAKRKTLLIDAHKGAIAAMALTVDGHYLATASERGTIVRLFEIIKGSHSDFPSSSSSSSSSLTTPVGAPLREFRRGVEQAVIGSLSFSLDKCWLACSSDRGTVHIFQVEDENPIDSVTRNGMKQKKQDTFTSSSSSFAQKIFTMSPRKHLLEGESSFVQVRGVTHPKVCAFVPDQPHTIAVAGLDNIGNGCLLIASFGPSTSDSNQINEIHNHSIASSNSNNKAVATKGEAKKIAYHRFFKRGNEHNLNANIGLDMNGEDFKFNSIQNEINSTSNGIGEITFGDDADGFVSITAEHRENE